MKIQKAICAGSFTIALLLFTVAPSVFAQEVQNTGTPDLTVTRIEVTPSGFSTGAGGIIEQEATVFIVIKNAGGGESLPSKLAVWVNIPP